jgi:hypothetical protein
MDPFVLLSVSGTLSSLLPSAVLVVGLGGATLFLFWPRT